jgi:hypothetical protein
VAFWNRLQHQKCDPADRASAFRCSRCFDRNYGDRLAKRRCWYCSTDAFWWGNWTMIDGALACERCSTEYERGMLFWDHARAWYRGRRSDGGPRTRQNEVYYQVVDLKENPEQNAFLAVPLGNVLSSAVREALRPFPWATRPILAPAPSSDPERHHGQLLVAQAARSLSLEVIADLLSKRNTGQQKTRGLYRRRSPADQEYVVTHSVEGRVVVVADDIITTASTLQHCARALKDAGAKAVIGAAILRVINPPRPKALMHGRRIVLNAEMRVVPDVEPMDISGMKASEAWLRFLCSRCPKIVKTGPVLLPVRVSTHTVRCSCDEQHNVRLRVNGGNLFISLAGRRSSEVICHVR